MKKAFLFSAKNQVTLWGPNGEINDYSAREWAGLTGDYYYGRWELYFKTLFECLDNNRTLDHEVYHKKAVEYGLKWDSDVWINNENDLQDNMFDINHENPVDLIEKQYQSVFGKQIEKFEFVKDSTSLPETVYFVSKTTSVGRCIDDLLCIDILSAICDSDPECAGFDSNGSLFKNTVHPSPAVGVNLYVKRGLFVCFK